MIGNTNAATDKLFPFLFNVEQPSNQQYTPLFETLVHNLPVSEGTNFTIAANFTGLIVNTANEDDFFTVEVSTRYFNNSIPFVESFTIYPTFDVTTLIMEPIAITFPSRKDIATSSHRLKFSIATHQINNPSVRIALEKEKKDINFIMAAPYMVPNGAQIAEEFEINFKKTKAKISNQYQKDYHRSFNIQFNKLNNDLIFSNTTLTFSSNATSFQLVPYPKQKIQNCTFTSLAATFTTPVTYIGHTWGFQPIINGPTIPKSSNLTITCPQYDLSIEQDDYNVPIIWNAVAKNSGLQAQNAYVHQSFEKDNSATTTIICMSTLVLTILTIIF